MSAYEPPTQILPIFDVDNFIPDDDNPLTLGEAERIFVKNTNAIVNGSLSVGGTTTLLGTLSIPTYPDVSQELTNINNDIDTLIIDLSGISYNPVTDTTTIDNSLNITGTFSIPSYPDVSSHLTEVDASLNNIETRITGITYTSGTDTTTIDNSLNITGTFSIPSYPNVSSHLTLVDASLNNIETRITGISYDAPTDKTIIDNSLNVVGQSVFLSPVGIGQTPLSPYMLDVRNLATNDTRLMINDCSLCTTNTNASLNLFIRENLTKEHIHMRRAFTTGGGLQVKDFGMSVDDDGSLTMGKYDNAGNYEELLYVNENHTIDVDGDEGGDYRIVKTGGNITLSGTAAKVVDISYNPTTDTTLVDGSLNVIGTLSIPSYPNVSTTLNNYGNSINTLNGITTGITYTTGTDLTTIDNSLNVVGTFSIPSYPNVSTTLNNYGNSINTLTGITTGITYDLATDTTTIDNSFNITGANSSILKLVVGNSNSIAPTTATNRGFNVCDTGGGIKLVRNNDSAAPFIELESWNAAFNTLNNRVFLGGGTPTDERFIVRLGTTPTTDVLTIRTTGTNLITNLDVSGNYTSTNGNITLTNGTVTAASFSGTTTNANNILATSDNSSGNYYIPFIKTSGTGNKALFIDDTTTPITINPNTGDIRMIGLKNDVANTNVALGVNAGAGQGTNTGCIAIGNNAGLTAQNNNAVAIGPDAGKSNQSINAFALGRLAGEVNQGINCVAIGIQAGQNNQALSAIAIGEGAGQNSQGSSGLAIGFLAGRNQSSTAIAIGNTAGQTNQGINSIAIGNAAGNSGQVTNAIAIGRLAGNSSQGQQAIAIGNTAGQTTQGLNGIAVGVGAGTTSQQQNCVAIGTNAGNTGQGERAIAIGFSAGQTNQTSGSIALNASSVALNPNVAGIFIDPVRGVDLKIGIGNVFYNSTTKELQYSTTNSKTEDITDIILEMEYLDSITPKTLTFNPSNNNSWVNSTSIATNFAYFGIVKIKANETYNGICLWTAGGITYDYVAYDVGGNGNRLAFNLLGVTTSAGTGFKTLPFDSSITPTTTKNIAIGVSPRATTTLLTLNTGNTNWGKTAVSNTINLLAFTISFNAASGGYNSVWNYTPTASTTKYFLGLY